jgi:plasmid stabilization system protein ParE
LKIAKLHRFAKLEVVDAVRYYDKADDPSVSIDFRRRLRAALVDIREHPQRFPRYERSAVRRRLLGRFPYQIFYTDHGPYVHILAIAHTSRRPGYWKSRIAVA